MAMAKVPLATMAKHPKEAKEVIINGTMVAKVKQFKHKQCTRNFKTSAEEIIN